MMLNSPLCVCVQVLQEIIDSGVKIYTFPDTEGDEEEAAANKKLRVSSIMIS